MKNKSWSVSDISNPLPLRSNEIEFKDNKGEWHIFDLIFTAEKIVFGGVCNTGFIESGYILRDDTESFDETISEMYADLEVYYNVGSQYVSRIVCNERM